MASLASDSDGGALMIVPMLSSYCRHRAIITIMPITLILSTTIPTHGHAPDPRAEQGRHSNEATRRRPAGVRGARLSWRLGGGDRRRGRLLDRRAVLELR